MSKPRKPGKVTNLDAVRNQRRGAIEHARGEAVRFDPYVFDGQVAMTKSASGEEVVFVITDNAAGVGVVMQAESAMSLGAALHTLGLQIKTNQLNAIQDQLGKPRVPGPLDAGHAAFRAEMEDLERQALQPAVPFQAPSIIDERARPLILRDTSIVVPELGGRR